MNKKSRLACITFLIISLLSSYLLTGCSSFTDNTQANTQSGNEYREFTDSTGRTFQLPKKITRVVASGLASQIVLIAICPDLLVANSIDEDIPLDYFGDQYKKLPFLGQVYGGKEDFNVEELIKVQPDLVLDIGEGKKGIKEDLDELTAKTGIPFVHIECTLSDSDQTYQKLGELLDRQEEAKVLSDYCRNTYDKMVDFSENVNKTRALYITYFGNYGVIAKGSFHAECFDLLADNIAVVDEVSNKGTGNQVDFEQILEWNPDAMIIGGDNTEELMQDSRFVTLDAVKQGKCYCVPVGPFNWFGTPPSVQRFLGMIWLADALYPEQTDYDLYEETEKYFQLFYHTNLSKEEFEMLGGHN